MKKPSSSGTQSQFSRYISVPYKQTHLQIYFSLAFVMVFDTDAVQIPIQMGLQTPI